MAHWRTPYAQGRYFQKLTLADNKQKEAGNYNNNYSKYFPGAFKVAGIAFFILAIKVNHQRTKARHGN